MAHNISLMYNNFVETKKSTLDEFKTEAITFASKLNVNKKATVVALHGDLGSGKTTFTQFVAEFFGVKDIVVSPTFLIQKKYALNNGIFSNLIHIDAYRLEDASQLEVLDWSDISSNPLNLIFIEWAENVSELLGKDTEHIYFNLNI